MGFLAEVMAHFFICKTQNSWWLLVLSILPFMCYHCYQYRQPHSYSLRLGKLKFIILKTSILIKDFLFWLKWYVPLKWYALNCINIKRNFNKSLPSLHQQDIDLIHLRNTLNSHLYASFYLIKVIYLDIVYPVDESFHNCWYWRVSPHCYVSFVKESLLLKNIIETDCIHWNQYLRRLHQIIRI